MQASTRVANSAVCLRLPVSNGRNSDSSWDAQIAAGIRRLAEELLMLVRDMSVQILAERPVRRITFLHRVLSVVLCPVIRTWRYRARARQENMVVELTKWVQCVKSRDELESVLGRPVYGLPGAQYELVRNDGQTVCPEIVEVYRTKGCIFEIWFSNKQMCAVDGWIELSSWDIVCGVNPTQNPTGQATD
jgi:hypothetical protein